MGFGEQNTFSNPQRSAGSPAAFPRHVGESSDMMYFDHAATTPLDERVLAVMMPWLHGLAGNPSSIHTPGRRARAAVEAARHRIATLMGVDRASTR